MQTLPGVYLSYLPAVLQCHVLEVISFVRKQFKTNDVSEHAAIHSLYIYNGFPLRPLLHDVCVVYIRFD